ncbi:hypothetical protein [Leptothoe sp. PORK10 BA2]|uniref:hypothetical protein n=1 Tax=Leptothoe sp. PORK10 BA2 TaxID=3110254 RepID=UPI002B220687|nr:hypothetical protein [Leptothoe sp. PORK10 BA2]MEA5464908.1 hypothetical protein [Leptothoe sp. PORK10 BA2]
MNKLAIVGIGVGVLSIGLYFGANLYGTKVAEAKVNKLINSMEEDNLAVEYKDISYKALAQDVHVENVTIKSKDDPGEMTIEKVIIREIDEKSDVPKAFDASIQGLVVDLNQPEQLEMANFLKQAGYDSELKFDIDTKYRYDQAKREMSVDTFKVSADQVGDLSINMKLGNVDVEDFESQKTSPPVDTIFHGFEITYRDNSFADKLFAAMAAEKGVTVDELKAQMTSQLTGASQFLVSSDNQVATDAVNEVVAFIENPEGFSVSMKPEQPLQFASLMGENPDNWVDMLNIEIKSF